MQLGEVLKVLGFGWFVTELVPLQARVETEMFCDRPWHLPPRAQLWDINHRWRRLTPRAWGKSKGSVAKEAVVALGGEMDMDGRTRQVGDPALGQLW
jgi:hypothetical protein